MNAHTASLQRDEMRRGVSTATVVPARSTDVRPELRLVQTPTRKRRLTPLSGALTAVALILVTMFAQLGLSIAVSEGAYETRALQLELRDLTRVERVLALNADKLASPQNLAENAMRLGMAQNTTPATLRLSDNAVLGTLVGATSAAAGSLVPNATLEGLPVVDADGLLADRNLEQAAGVAEPVANAPIAWEGALPAPRTH